MRPHTVLYCTFVRGDIDPVAVAVAVAVAAAVAVTDDVAGVVAVADACTIPAPSPVSTDAGAVDTTRFFPSNASS